MGGREKARLRAVRHKSEGVQAQIREALLLRQVYDLILFVIMILVELIIPRILRFRGVAPVGEDRKERHPRQAVNLWSRA